MYSDIQKLAGRTEPINNPIEIERDFQGLLLALSCPGTPRQRLFKINGFLEKLGNNFTEHESYLLELIERLPDLVRDLNCLGCDPATLQALFEKTLLLHAHFSLSDDVPGLAEVVEKLRRAVACLYAYAGEVGVALKILEEKFSETSPAWLNLLVVEPASRPLLLLQRAHEEARRHDETAVAKLHPLLAQWAPHDANSAVVPVVEHSLNDVAIQEGEGGLRRIAVKILGEAKTGKDDIHADVAVFGAESEATAVTQIPIAAARRLLVENHPSMAKRFFTGQVAFETAHALHEGASANLAIAALFYCAALYHTDQRERFNLAPGVALTGDLNKAGEVLPVDGKTLATKVKAAFFSWVEYLVVPKSQRNEAEAAARSFAQRYPHRALTIIGVGHLREIFFDRRLTRRECAGMTKHLARQAWRNKFTVGGMATTGLLVLIIGKLLYGPVDRNPIAGEFVEESLLVKNKYGKVIDRIWMGAPTVRRANTLGPDNELQGLHYVTFFDIDGDALNEIFWLQWPDEKTENPAMIYCKSVKEDSLQWSVPLRQTLHFPRKPDVTSDLFMPKHVAAGDFDRNGKAEIFVVACHDFFPSLVMKLNAKDGKELGNYVHIGHLSPMKFVDLDSDGITEILLCGTNNAFRQACVVALDPRFIAGHSPLAGDYALENYEPGLERAYMLIPKTIVGEAFPEESKFNEAKTMTIQESNRKIQVLIDDLVPLASTQRAALFGYWDFDLQAQSFGTLDNYDLMAETLFRESRISRLPDYEYFEAYNKTMRYWDGEGWQNQPVMNKHYLEAVKAK
jgi:hypothetical protein